jgi:hypothetical protein
MNSPNKNDSGMISPEKDIPVSREATMHGACSVDRDSSDLGAYLDFLEEIEAFRSKKIETVFLDACFEL